jgi:hypothetical protein
MSANRPTPLTDAYYAPLLAKGIGKRYIYSADLVFAKQLEQQGLEFKKERDAANAEADRLADQIVCDYCPAYSGCRSGTKGEECIKRLRNWAKLQEGKESK